MYNFIAQYGDKEVLELWSLLPRKLPGMFKGLEIEPLLLHGDLWSGSRDKGESVWMECLLLFMEC